MKNLSHFINGQLYAGTSGREATCFEPALGQVAASVPLAHKEDVAIAVAAAHEALPGWAETPAARRAKILFAARGLLLARHEAFAETITREHGKTLAEARDEVHRGIEAIEFACGAPQLLKGGHADQVETGLDNWHVREPLGVVACVTPYNLPLLAPCWMVPLAVACGNTVVLKPSERTPATALLLADAFLQAGLPGGVFNVIHGDGAAVEALIDHPDVAAISFAGTSAVAETVYVRAAQRGKRIQALGGAKNAVVVCPDADLDRCAQAVTAAAYGSCGGGAAAASVVIAVGAIGDRLVERLADHTRGFKVGNGLHPASRLGPLITAQLRARVAGYIEDGALAGAAVRVDGRQCAVPGHEKGFFIGPSLLDHVKPTMNVYREEILGPVLCVLRVNDLAQALALVNAHPYAHTATCFTQNGGTARTFARLARVGTVGINVAAPVPQASQPLGGARRSLLGGHPAQGMAGVHFYTHLKSVVQGWRASE